MAKAYVIGTFDTKQTELDYIANLIRSAGTATVRVDVSTQASGADVEISAAEVAAHHTEGARAVFGKTDRGAAVSAMAEALEQMIRKGLPDLGGVIAAGGSGNTALVTPAMQALPVGVPKLVVSTVASGDVRAYVGPCDITMVYAVTDVQGLNRISRQVLGNAAHAMAGMIRQRDAIDTASDRPAIGLTMFGVTTACVQAMTQILDDQFDSFVFHATGTGGRSMEKLAESALLAGVLDVTTTEIADLVVGGIMAATPDRMDVFARTKIPYVGSCGALDMVNFGALDSIPERYKGRLLHSHNAQVTLMRTNADENRQIGRFIAEKLNAMQGPTRFLIPKGGVSILDAPGQPFHDPDADLALFETLESHVEQNENRRLISLDYNINDPAFAAAAIAQFSAIAGV